MLSPAVVLRLVPLHAVHVTLPFCAPEDFPFRCLGNTHIVVFSPSACVCDNVCAGHSLYGPFLAPTPAEVFPHAHEVVTPAEVCGHWFDGQAGPALIGPVV